jgi:hypothetical protein
MGVVIGVIPGSWLCNHIDYCQAGTSSSFLSKEMGILAILLLLVKLVTG